MHYIFIFYINLFFFSFFFFLFSFFKIYLLFFFTERCILDSRIVLSKARANVDLYHDTSVQASLYCDDIPYAPGGRAQLPSVIPLTKRLANNFVSSFDALTRRRNRTDNNNNNNDESISTIIIAECTDIQCGGPTYCVHKWLPPVCTRAVHTWRLFDVPLPTIALPVELAQARCAVDALLSMHASPADMIRCGADAERLAILGITLAYLIEDQQYTLESLCDSLISSWRSLQALGFHAEQLRDRSLYPVVTLAREPIVLDVSKLHEYNVRYETLVDEGLQLNAHELVALGYDASMLMAIGMRAKHVAHSICELVSTSTNNGNMREAALWYVRAFDVTPPLFGELRAHVSDARELSIHEHEAFSQLATAVAALPEHNATLRQRAV